MSASTGQVNKIKGIGFRRRIIATAMMVAFSACSGNSVLAQQIGPIPNPSAGVITISGPGEFNSTYFENFGTVAVAAGATLTNSGLISNGSGGAIQVDLGGSLSNLGTVINLGTMTSAGSVSGAGTLSNSGTLVVTGGASAFDSTSNLAAGTLSGGTWSVSGGALTLNGGAAITTITTGTTVSLSGNGTLNSLPSTLTSNAGTLNVGSGATFVSARGSRLCPGD